MNFCGNCGARATGTPFCTNCGQPLAPPAQGQPTAASPDGGEPGVTPPGSVAAASAPGAVPRAPGQPAAARATPFSAITVSDYVRDFAALLLLLIPLGMAWDFADNATGKVYVILVTLLSVVSLSLPYLKAASVLPPTLTAAQLRLVRLAANVPYFVVVLITLVFGYLGDTTSNGLDVGDGVGVGLVIGFVGALLAAQARSSELGPTDTDGALWRLVALGLAGLGVVLGILSVIIFMIDVGDSLEWSELAALLVGVILFVGVIAGAAAGLYKGDAAWRDTTIVLGVVGLMAAFWALSAEQTIHESWSLRLESPRFLFWPAVGAAAAAAGVGLVVRAAPGARRWIGLTARLFDIAVVIAGLSVLYYGFQLVENEAGRGSLITVLVLSLIALAAVFVGRNALTRDAAAGRPVAIGVAGALVIIGIVMATVLGTSDSTVVDAVSATVISAWFVFAVAIAASLTAPKSVRDELGQFTLGQGGRGTAAATVGGGAAAGASAADGAEPVDRPSMATADPAYARPAERPSDAERSTTPEEAGEQHGANPADDAGNTDDETVVAEAAGGTEPAGEADAAQALTSTDADRQADPAAAEDPAAVPVTDDATRVMSATGQADEDTGDDATRVMSATGRADENTGDDATHVMSAQQPAAPVAPEPEAPSESGYTAAMASDPATPLQTLADIAAKDPSLRPNIALNPSTYPELLEWLGQLGDPAVDDALRRR